jgi:endonuclease/exonuclease/phosphatase (EEP) superfamily protein YafD
MTSITISTWNLARPGWTGNERNQAILEQIQKVDADIWVLTETNEESIRLDGYHSLATPAVAYRNRGERTAMIWSRWPLQKVPVFTDLPAHEEPARTYPSYTARSQDTAPAVCATVDVPAGPLLVYGTVITWFGDRGPWGTSTYNSEQQLSIDAHGRDWRRLREAYGGLPMIVAGDFDATCDTRSYPTVKTCSALRNALDASELTCLTRAHWIDHICVSATLEARATVFEPWQRTYHSPRTSKETPVSDHHGVHITLSFA